MVQNKRSRLILDATYVRRERINGTVRVLCKACLIFSRINGPIVCFARSENYENRDKMHKNTKLGANVV